MSAEYFNASLEVEKQFMQQIICELERHFGFKLVKDVRERSDFQQRDVDLVFYDRILGVFTVEVKVRLRDYGDILLETKSCVERDTAGYLYKSEAVMLAYAVAPNKQLKRLYLLHLPSLRDWFMRNKHRYKPRLAPNPPDNPVYHSEFYAVPIEHLPSSVFFQP